MRRQGVRPANSDVSFGVERHMRQLSFTVSVLCSHWRRAVSTSTMFLRPRWDGPRGKYRPEDHYMRGPGPKWRERHALDRTSAGGT